MMFCEFCRACSHFMPSIYIRKKILVNLWQHYIEKVITTGMTSKKLCTCFVESIIMKNLLTTVTYVIMMTMRMMRTIAKNIQK